MINFKRRFHGNGTSIQFYTVPNLNLQDLSYHMVYHLFEGEGGTPAQNLPPLAPLLLPVKLFAITKNVRSVNKYSIRTFLNFWINANNDHFPVKVFIFRYYEMMDNTPAKKCRKSPKNSPQNCHIWPPFSPIYLRKCLTNSGRYILSQGTEEKSNAICSLDKLLIYVCKKNY